MDLNPEPLRPLQMGAYLKQRLVGQDEALYPFAGIVSNHINLLRGPADHPRLRSHTALTGPEGAGKSSLVRHAAAYAQMPLVTAEASEVTSQGLAGAVQYLFSRLVPIAKNMQRPEKEAMIHLRRLQRIPLNPGGPLNSDHPQAILISLLQGVEVGVGSQILAHPQSNLETPTVDTSRLLFVLDGDFDENSYRGEDTDRRGDPVNHSLVDLLHTDILRQLPNRLQLNPLTRRDLYALLHRPKCDALEPVKALLVRHGIELTFRDSGYQALAALAEREGHGGRGLNEAVAQAFQPYLQVLPSTGIQNLVVTARVVLDPAYSIPRLLRKHPLIPEYVRPERVGEESAASGSARPSRRTSLDVQAALRGKIPDAYISDAAHYLLKTGCRPMNLKRVIERFTKGVSAYATACNAQYGVQLEFTQDATESIVRIALSRGAKKAEDVIYQRLEPLDLKKLKENGITQIKVDYTTFFDPGNSMSKLLRTANRPPEGSAS